MKYCILALFGLATLSMAAEPVYYELNDFLQGAKRNPNKCVNKGKTFKCVGYEEIEGAIFNTNTNHYYAYVRNSYSESYAEFACDSFYVKDANGVEKIVFENRDSCKEIYENIISNFLLNSILEKNHSKLPSYNHFLINVIFLFFLVTDTESLG